MQAVENIFHAPSNFNATSIIDRRTLNNDDDKGLIPYLLEKVKNSMAIEDDSEDKLFHVGDSRGDLLCRLKEELL